MNEVDALLYIRDILETHRDIEVNQDGDKETINKLNFCIKMINSILTPRNYGK